MLWLRKQACHWRIILLTCSIQVAVADGAERKEEYNVKYAIIGAGLSGRAAASEIRRQEERLNSKLDADSITLIDSFAQSDERQGIQSYSVISDKVVAIDPDQRKLKLLSGGVIRYEKCLLSTGLSYPSYSRKFVAEECLEDVLDPRNTLHWQKACDLVSKGKHVTLLGGMNWNNIALACRISEVGRSKGYTGVVTLVYPAYGPLAITLPRYLSHALAKRLSTLGVEVIPYSQLRYISRAVQGDLTSPLCVYLMKSYDSLNSSLFTTHAVILSAETVSSPALHEDYQIFQDAGIEIDSISGGLRVNRWLEAGQGIYAAGECASVLLQNYRQPCTGSYLAELSGKLAGRNMVRNGPGWQFSTLPMQSYVDTHSSLYLTTIGHCSSALPSHGYFFKYTSVAASNRINQSNNSTVRRPELLRDMKENLKGSFDLNRYAHQEQTYDTSSDSSISARGMHNIKKVAQTNRAKEIQLASLLPPLGFGVVFYVDEATHSIAGILITGLPVYLNHSLQELFYKYINRVVEVKNNGEYDANSVRLRRYHTLSQYAQDIKSSLLANQVQNLSKQPSNLRDISTPLMKDIGNNNKYYYRYAGSAQSTVNDITEHYKNIAQQQYTKYSEPILGSKTNTGSRSDRLSAAYTRKILEGFDND